MVDLRNKVVFLLVKPKESWAMLQAGRKNAKRLIKGDMCTEAQARYYMQNDLKKFEQAVNRSVKVQLTQNQCYEIYSST